MLRETKYRCLAALASLAVAVPLHAQTGAPCDASRPIKGCRAEIRLEGRFIVLTSSTPRCSVIVWTLDGARRSTTVLDGEESLELLTTRPKELGILSCVEVKDLRAIGPTGGGDEEDDMTPVYRQMPEYPPAMRRMDVQGKVVVEVRVRPDGGVSGARVLSSANPGLDAAAVAAAYGWRFAPTPRGGVAEIPFVFSLTD